MALYLVQHGKCVSKTIDPEKGLSEEGIADVRRIAEVAAGYAIGVGLILHSGKKRAAQTADIFGAYLKPAGGIGEIDGIKPLDDVAAFARTISVDDNAMIVGHLPFMERLTAYLILGAPEPSVFQFQNGGIVCLGQLAESRRWIIRWALMPNIG